MTTEKWSTTAHADHYAKARWKNARAAGRDPRIVAAILDRYGVCGPVLDAPSGTGRMHDLLSALTDQYVGSDVSFDMLEKSPAAVRVVASVDRLPFPDAHFDVVVSCRLLHHIHDGARREAILRELNRVTSRLVVASFWDASSWHAFRRRVGLRRDEGERGRRAISKTQLAREVDAAGLELCGFHHSFRFVSQQTFFVAKKRT